jgi:cyclopropane-fatty-acyl-phospholipid synthase
MGYAAGIFHDPRESLEIGQNRKVEQIERDLGIRQGFRLLDVGCGWGNLLLPLADRFDGHFHGITLSETQRAYLLERAATAGVGDRVQVSVGHVEELPLRDGDYDGVVFSGSLIHMHLRRNVHRLVGRVLRPGGVQFISDSYVPARLLDALANRAADYIRETFGSTRILTLSQELSLIEAAGLDIREVRELTDSYIITINHWIRNIRAHRERLEQLIPGFAKRLQSYMTLGKLAFQRRTALEYIIIATKP